MSKLSEDPRIDPRIKRLFGKMPAMGGRDMASREEVLERNQSEKAVAGRAVMTAFAERADNEELAPSTGLTTTVEEFTSQPDGNTIKVRFIRPDGVERPRACTIHGGGAATMSAFDGNYRAWAASSPPAVWRWRWWTSATRWWPPRRRRWRRTRRGSTTACRACTGWWPRPTAWASTPSFVVAGESEKRRQPHAGHRG
ncbi:MAG: hypothetical protein R2755_24345 [Acidimicrobiales bacterium]